MLSSREILNRRTKKITAMATTRISSDMSSKMYSQFIAPMMIRWAVIVRSYTV